MRRMGQAKRKAGTGGLRLRVLKSPPCFNMKKYIYLFSLGGAVLLCGCDKQTKLNGQKIDALSQKIARLEQMQANQVMLLQSQLKSLPPTIDKMSSAYFEKNHDAALFFHTNTLYLLLTVGKQIESRLQAADAERQAQNSQAYSFHTNQINLMHLCTAHVEDALISQEKRTVEKITTENRQANMILSNALIKAVSEGLSKQIKTLAPDAAEIARRRKLETDVAQIQDELARLKDWLEKANRPAAHP